MTPLFLKMPLIHIITGHKESSKKGFGQNQGKTLFLRKSLPIETVSVGNGKVH